MIFLVFWKEGEVMAGQRQPIELIKAKGKKHLTKQEIEEREATEVHANNDNIQAPSYLNKKQKEKFNEIAKELKDIGIMSNLDCDCLARYIISHELYVKAVKKVNNKEVQSDIFELEKYSNLMDKYYKQARSSANDLGLSISSRCKLVVPKVKEKPKENKFAKFGVANG